MMSRIATEDESADTKSTPFMRRSRIFREITGSQSSAGGRVSQAHGPLAHDVGPAILGIVLEGRMDHVHLPPEIGLNE